MTDSICRAAEVPDENCLVRRAAGKPSEPWGLCQRIHVPDWRGFCWSKRGHCQLQRNNDCKGVKHIPSRQAKRMEPESEPSSGSRGQSNSWAAPGMPRKPSQKAPVDKLEGKERDGGGNTGLKETQERILKERESKTSSRVWGHRTGWSVMKKPKAVSDQRSFLEEERVCDLMGAHGGASGRLTKFPTRTGVSKAARLIMIHWARICSVTFFVPVFYFILFYFLATSQVGS